MGTDGRHHKSSLRHCKKLPPLTCPFVHARHPPHVFLGAHYAAWHRTQKSPLRPLLQKTHPSCSVSLSCLVPYFLLARGCTATHQRHPPCHSMQVSVASASDSQYPLWYCVKGNHRQAKRDLHYTFFALAQQFGA